MPILAEILTSTLFSVKVFWKSLQIFDALLSRSSREGKLLINTKNSSPPTRPMISFERKRVLRCCANCAKTISPNKWPKISFTLLKLSTSTIMRAKELSGSRFVVSA